MEESDMGSSTTGDRLRAPGYGILPPEEGSGLLDWSWAAERLSSSHMYWIATVRPDSRPHVMPVWGVWLDNVFYFSSGRQSRKGRNLAANAHCVVSVQDGTNCVIVEGEAKEVSVGPFHAAVCSAYLAKYQSDLEELGEPIYEIHPTVAFGLQESDFVGSATRWKFSAAKTQQ
jgi:nitroimidazol reductase NimA-like FMN-containing flavoprotein (pyridoxamine 5'-phosphate oxidase superfamily)